MKEKEGRDYIGLEDCIARVIDGGTVVLSTMGESIRLSPDEFKELVKFVAASTASKEQV